LVDPRCSAGAPPKCFAALPDEFVRVVARHAGIPAPDYVFMLNANPSPVSETGEQHREAVCEQCVVERWPELADALEDARNGYVMVREAGGWGAWEWSHFGPPQMGTTLDNDCND
jgi:hypothetical protein